MLAYYVYAIFLAFCYPIIVKAPTYRTAVIDSYIVQLITGKIIIYNNIRKYVLEYGKRFRDIHFNCYLYAYVFEYKEYIRDI